MAAEASLVRYTSNLATFLYLNIKGRPGTSFISPTQEIYYYRRKMKTTPELTIYSEKPWGNKGSGHSH